MQAITKLSIDFGTHRNFQYYVGKSAGLRLDAQLFGIEAGFMHEIDAIRYAGMIQDDRNFTIVYGNTGKTLHTFLPDRK